MNPRIAAIAALATALSLSTAAQAALIAEWNLTGQPGDQASTAAAVLAPELTSASLNRGAGLTGAAAANSINASGWNGQSTDYFGFTLNLTAGATVDFETLFVGTRSSNTGPGSIGVSYSLDGFTTSTALTTLSQAPGSNFVNSAIDLSAMPNVTGTVEFRFFQLGTTAANGAATGTGGTFRITDYFAPADQNLSFTGTSVSAVPLPAAGWLLVAGLGALGWTGRRRG